MMQYSRSQPIVILVANGFLEQETLHCVAQMRQINLPVMLVGISSGLVTGQRGIKIKPDYSLEEMKIQKYFPKMLVLPNGIQTSLATDPRIDQLVRRTLTNQGIIAAMSTAEPYVFKQKSVHSDQFIIQGNNNAEAFIEQLIDMAL